jgi:group I intron endonuclease
MEIYIYSLKHPITKEVRYIGKTKNIKRRYYEHINKKHNSYKSNWIQSLLKKDLKPIIDIIEICNKDNWEEREKYWITQFDNLTNLTKGGENYEATEELRKKFSLLNSGVNNPNYGKKASKETRQKLSNSNKDKIFSEAHKLKLKIPFKKQKCLIDNIEYETIREASRVLNINHTTIKKRCVSKNFINYMLIE